MSFADAILIKIHIFVLKINITIKSKYSSIQQAKIMRTIQEYDPTDYYFLLKSVIDSRLLFSTKKYIAEHIGYSSLTSKNQ